MCHFCVKDIKKIFQPLSFPKKIHWIFKFNILVLKSEHNEFKFCYSFTIYKQELKRI